MKILSETTCGYIVEIDHGELNIICSDYTAKYEWKVGERVDLDRTLKRLKEVIVSNDSLMSGISAVLSLGNILNESKKHIEWLNVALSELIAANSPKDQKNENNMETKKS